MKELKDLIQTADWKQEKHVPNIELLEKAKGNYPQRPTSGSSGVGPRPNATNHTELKLERRREGPT